MIAAHTALHITDEQFNAVYFEIEATLRFLGVPEPETEEFMAVIEHYRPEVTQQQKVEQAGTLEPAAA